MTEAMPAANPLFGEEEGTAVYAAFAPDGLAWRQQFGAFEQEYAGEVSDREWAAFNSVTSTPHMAVMALGIADRGELIVLLSTVPATANTVPLTGTVPVVVDSIEDSLCIKPEVVQAELTPRTKAVVSAHFYGHASAAQNGRGPRGEGSSWVS